MNNSATEHGNSETNALLISELESMLNDDKRALDLVRAAYRNTVQYGTHSRIYISSSGYFSVAYESEGWILFEIGIERAGFDFEEDGNELAQFDALPDDVFESDVQYFFAQVGYYMDVFRGYLNP